jgi:DNA repair protein SbcD/Mre11
MKFLHAADIHLDSPLAGLRARADLPDDVIRHCTRRAFTAMIDLAMAEDVAFVVIAGDLYDGDWKDFSTGLFFAEEMRRLGRPCFLLRGNHDARSLISRNLTLPSNVREFSPRTCQTATLANLGVALHGHSFPNRAVLEDLSAGYPPPVTGMFNIGVLHTSAEDPGEHETYAPCNVAGLTIKGYDYWALGHIHARRVLAERPWIVFPGNLQGRHPKETGPKGCTLVTVEDRQVVAVEHRSVDVLRWAALVVDATGADVATLTGRIADAVGAALAAADGRPVLARVTLIGATELHGRLQDDAERLAAECRNAAIEADGRLYVESVRVRTRPMPVAQDDVLAPLRAAFAAGLDDPAVVASLLEELASLRQRLPAAARAGLDLPGDEDGLRILAGEAWQIAAGALVASEPG